MRRGTLTSLLIAFAGAGFGCSSTASDALPTTGVRDGGAAPDTSSAAAGHSSDSGTTPLDAGADPVAPSGDPNLDGPYAYAEKDETTTIPTTGDTVAIHVAYPTSQGKFPVVVFGHGFQLPPSLYAGYLKRLASFGYVALTVDYPASLQGPDNPSEAKDMLGGVDWAAADSTFGAKVDTSRVGMTGHSLGGKIALLAATMDARVKAVIALDPVDGGGGLSGCKAPSCVIVASSLPSLHIPTAFVGETTDATGSFQACAPAAANFMTFYTKANSPSLSVTVSGANHMSFLDDLSSCGVVCSFCNAAKAPQAQVLGMARAYVAAFFERHLRGDTSFDTYLTGALANSRYVATGQAAITSK